MFDLSKGALKSFSTLAAAALVFGLGEAFVTSSSAAMVADMCKARPFGTAMGVFGTIFDVGHASGPILSGILVGAWGYFPTFAVRIERQSVARPLKPGRWHQLRLEIVDRHLTAFLNGEPAMTFDADRSLAGYVGLWTKADSVTWFRNFEVTQSGVGIGLDLFKDLKRTPTEKAE
jgi:MFS family permease